MSKLFVFANISIHDLQSAKTIHENLENNFLLVQKNFPNRELILLGSTLWEFHSTETLENTNRFLKKLSKKYNIKSHLLYNKAVDQIQGWDNSNAIPYNFFLNKILHSTRAFDQKLNLVWNHEDFRLLFLTGKLHKKNRIGVLLRLAENGLLNKKNCVYSLHYKPQTVNEISKIANLDPSVITEFLEKYQNNPDGADFIDLEDTTHYDGVPFNHKLYKKTSFSLISESESGGNEIWITEKTWRTILNKHPFIVIGQAKTLEYLKSIGIKTFQEYLPYQYDNIADLDQRLTTVMDNILWLKDNWHTLDFAAIKKDIEHNFSLATSISRRDILNFNKAINYMPGDYKIHAGLYSKNEEKEKIIDISRDHICYYNWANYNTRHFWRNK